MKFPTTDQEQKLRELFFELTTGFKEFDKSNNVSRQEILLKELADKIKDGKALIKEFEREARSDAMATDELFERKTLLVNELNHFISIKKTQTQILNSRLDLIGGPFSRSEEGECRGEMSAQQIVSKGKKEMREVERSLGRAEKVVEDTIQIGTRTAAELRDQTKQMENVINDIDEIEFTMKKVRRVLTDMARGVLTDRFVRLILFLIIVAVMAVIALAIMDDGEDDSSLPKPKEIGGSNRKLLDLITPIHPDPFSGAIDDDTTRIDISYFLKR